MARGRMINSKITRNKAINDLSDDTSRLAFTWLVTFADVDGRCNGDPALVRSLVFPRRTDVTVAQMEGYIQEWADSGLIVWYEADGDTWIAFPSFEENQKGLDRRKEPGSDIPAPPSTDKAQSDTVPSTPQVRTEYVPSTCQVRSNRTEQNRSEVKSTSPSPADTEAQTAPHGTDDLSSELFMAVENAGIILNTGLADQYKDVLADIRGHPRPRELITAMFTEAKRANARPLPPWLRKVTDRCLQQGCMPGEWSDNGNRARASPSAKTPAADPKSFRNPITGKVETL